MITIYAIYHLARSPKARPPMSSASYHMFAIFMDVGVIPFYVFAGIFANQNILMDPKNEERWTSFFTADGATDTLLLATFIGSFVMAALHAVSTVLDLWLVILFRKIAKLPPDLNPLEDNLTSRNSSKHKYKNSEATLSGSIEEKNTKFLSGSTLNVDDESRLSTALKDVPESRQVPFRHSRTGSELGYSPHNPDSVRWSKQQMEESVYQQPPSARGSMASVRPHTRGSSTSPQKNAAFTITETPPTPTHSSRPISYPNHGSPRGSLASNRFSAPALQNAAPSNAVVRSQQQSSLLTSNSWVTLDNDDDGMDLGASRHGHQNYDENSQSIERHDSFQPQPLKMNPPTPPPPSDFPSNRSALGVRKDHGNAELGRHLTVNSNATAASSVYSESAPSLKGSSKSLSPGTPKGKYYGDLAAATRGVRGSASPPKVNNDRYRSNGTVDASGYDATGMSALGGYGYGSYPDPPSPSKVKAAKAKKQQQQYALLRTNDSRIPTSGTVDASGVDATGMSALGSYGFAPDPPPKVPKINRDGNGRVVSRTGVDLADASQYLLDSAQGQSRRREVSGKVAEEGRGGWWSR